MKAASFASRPLRRTAFQGLRAASPELARQLEARDYQRAGERLAGLLDQVRSLPAADAAAAAGSAGPAEIEAAVRAIEAGDFDRAEEAAASSGRSEEEVRALRERIRSLRRAIGDQ